MVFQDKEKNFTEWFEKVLREAEIIEDRFPAKGMYVLLSYGLFITETVILDLERLLFKTGHRKERYPTLIPYSVFMKEKDFFEGFQGEAYLIDKTLKKKLEEPLVLRPTSETAMYYIWSLRLRNYKQLPYKVFQTVNIFRCETKMTKPFLRLREVMFFNESHTAHRTLEDSERQIKEAIEIYKNFFDKLAIPYIIVKTPKWDTFPGALYNYDFITVMPDGKALELGSVINLGQKFSRAFDIKVLDPQPITYLGNGKYSVLLENDEELIIEVDKEKKTIKVNEEEYRIEEDLELGEKEEIINTIRKFVEDYLKEKNTKIKPWRYVFQTCYGISERVVGAYIAIHGDNKGLVLHPEYSPVQIIVVPIFYKEEKEKVLEKAKEIYNILKEKYRVEIDLSEKTPGEKFYFWEMKGVPIRIEIGPRDIENGTVTIYRRDLDKKYQIKFEDAEKEIEKIFKEFHGNLKRKAEEYFKRKIFFVENLEDIEKFKDKGIVLANMCESEDHSKIIEERFQREVMGFLVEGFERRKGRCIICGKETDKIAVIGKTY